jgi:Rad51
MQQSLITKPAVIQKQLPIKENKLRNITTRLAFNIADIDGLFPGFKAGDFAVLYGPQSVTSLTSQLCIRAQLSTQLGGLESDVVFIDCANSSTLSTLDHIKRVHGMRVYTAFRLTSLIMEKLQEVIERCDAKLVVISDIANPFLHDNLDDQEARTVYSQIMSCLANFARKHHIIIIATYLSHESSTRNIVLQEITSAKASTVLRFTKTPYTKEVELEKHPSYMLGVADLSSENQALTDFIDTARKGKNYFLM